MKAFELVTLWKSFDELMDSTDFTPEEKLNIGREMVVSMPAGPLCTQVPLTHETIVRRMELRLGALEKEIKPNGSGPESPGLPEAATQPTRGKGRKTQPLDS